MGSSPGGDGLPSEFYKALLWHRRKKNSTPGIVQKLTHFFNETGQGEAAGVLDRRNLSFPVQEQGRAVRHKELPPLVHENVDYKLFTDILMQRLTTALGEVIGSQPSAFLSKRLIDDNIRTVQYLIAKHGTFARPDRRQPGLAIVFLDQEKAYDRVNHEFLFAVLARFGVPEEYIPWVRLLYQNAKIKVFVNGYTGEVLWVRFGMRQGNPLSCVLFVAVIEGLAQ